MSFGFGQTASGGFSNVSAQASVFGSSTAKGPSYNFTNSEVQSPKVEAGKEKSENEPASKTTCPECDRYCNKKSKDTRNQHFSELLQDELQYIQPCMRTTVYAKILNFLHATKKSHFNNEGVVIEVEKNDKVLVEEQT
ncbi:unnamed protein product [Arctia plantaginis]|uniref:Uncharacterized protein n=1 Tax=Arctia plantaginis TaxID=874455 RepID=A0A8S0YP47_ARCPL|nr:unnamed protein product [Arctia plantaginis]